LAATQAHHGHARHTKKCAEGAKEVNPGLLARSESCPGMVKNILCLIYGFWDSKDFDNDLGREASKSLLFVDELLNSI
jgi:hypothetical protein